MMFGYGWALTAWGWALVCLAAGFCVIVVGAVYWLSRLIGRTSPHASMPISPGSPPARSTAEQILSERFARGEIDDREYGDRLTTLRSHPATDEGARV